MYNAAAINTPAHMYANELLLWFYKKNAKTKPKPLKIKWKMPEEFTNQKHEEFENSTKHERANTEYVVHRWKSQLQTGHMHIEYITWFALTNLYYS